MAFFARARSEFAYLTGAARMLRRVTPIARNRTRTFPDVLDELAARYGDNPALLGTGESFTYSGLLERANQYARWGLSQGVRKGDTVALMMQGRPEYLAIWMGLIRIGAVVALVNTNLQGQALAHCLNIVGARRMIITGAFAEALESARPHLEPPPRIWALGHLAQDYASLDEELANLPGDALPASERAALTIEEPALYIYTSGTTGLPKAAVINHYRVQAVMAAYAAACRSRESDRVYDALPLYHTSGGVLAPGIALMNGGSCFIRDRFSASEFWDDVVAHECTIFQYIGELCRYLLNAPHSPNETRHSIRICNGNGLRPDIWMEFKTRFRLPEIVEWYAATEGNVLLFNLDGKPGSIGRIPSWLKHRFQTRLIRFDLDRETPVRGDDGFCIECAPGEIGEAVGRITVDPTAPGQRFDGYADPAETERKILRDAFEPGDRWFRTGDLMKKDARGYFYFIDRIGDTFRWKGENVATSQVAETMTIFPGIKEANAYGVPIPGHDGNAGMAAIVAEEGLDLAELDRHLKERLPGYARPLFLRIRHDMDVTGTFKQRKVDLRRQAFDPSSSEDDIYFRDPQADAYRKLDGALYERIISGQLRL